MVQDAKKCLHGMYWSPDLKLPPMRKAHSLREGLFIFKKNSPDIVWNTLGTFENNPCTLAQAETVLQGMSVEGLSFRDLDQVRNFGVGCRTLQNMLEDSSFALNQQCACTLHGHVGKEEALEWGVFRRSQVALRNVDYIPPASDILPFAFEQGMAYLAEHVKSPQLRGLAVFLYMARMQFFYDCNKRTALLMAYGELLRNNINVFIIPKVAQEKFNVVLRSFYNTGQADDALMFLAEQGGDPVI